MTTNEQNIKLKKVNLKYLSLKLKRDNNNTGESQSNNNHNNNNDNKNILKTKLDCDKDNKKKNNNFFNNIKKKLSIKNLYKSKRKIINVEFPNNIEEGSSSSNDPINNEINLDINEINDCGNRNERNILSSANNESSVTGDESNVDKNITDCISPLEERLDGDDAANDVDTTEEIDPPSPEVLDRPTLFDLQDLKTKTKSNLAQELLKLSNCGWYWGNISGDEADSKLMGEPDGAFLIRDSADDRYLLTLSFKSAGKLLHARIECSGGMFSLCNQGENGRFPSILDLIHYSMDFSKSSIICYSRPRNSGSPAFPVRLIKPISRFTHVKSLQSLCRVVIRQNTRCDNINKLPLPNSIKGFIEEPYIC